jgi:hypothetical protein
LEPQDLLNKTRSILDELDNHLITRDKSLLIESRASHVIQGAINLIMIIRESYSAEEAAELERRLLNSIRATDPAKFTRGIRRIKNGTNVNE